MSFSDTYAAVSAVLLNLGFNVFNSDSSSEKQQIQSLT